MFLLKLVTLKCDAYDRVTLPDVWNVRFPHVVFNHPFWMHCSSILAQHPTISSVFWQTSTLTSTSLKISDLKQPWLSPCYGHAYLTCLEEDTWWDTFFSVQCFICLSLNKKTWEIWISLFIFPKTKSGFWPWKVQKRWHGGVMFCQEKLHRVQNFSTAC